VDSYKRNLILATVADCQDNWAQAADKLGMHRANLHKLSQRLGISRGSR
jgi:transcriptional regulator with GAF, ATPase, and Fis domain